MNKPLRKLNTHKNILIKNEEYNCDRAITICPEQAVEIVEKWAKENPVKTYKSVFLERMPNTKVEDNSDLPGCPHRYFNISRDCINNCVDCWNREYKEEE